MKIEELLSKELSTFKGEYEKVEGMSEEERKEHGYRYWEESTKEHQEGLIDGLSEIYEMCIDEIGNFDCDVFKERFLEVMQEYYGINENDKSSYSRGFFSAYKFIYDSLMCNLRNIKDL